MQISPEVTTIGIAALVHTGVLIWKLSDMSRQLKNIDAYLFNGQKDDVERLKTDVTELRIKYDLLCGDKES